MSPFSPTFSFLSLETTFLSVWRLEDNLVVILGKVITFFEAGSLIGLKLTSSVRLAGQGTHTMPQSLPPWGRGYMFAAPCPKR